MASKAINDPGSIVIVSIINIGTIDALGDA